MMRSLLVLGLMGLSLSGAQAYDGFSPLSGPDTAIPSPVCDVINFGFCPQPASPALSLPDPNEVAVRRPAPAPAPMPRRHRRTYRTD